MVALLWSLSLLAADPRVQADLHLDTPTQLYRKGVGFDAGEGLEGGLAQLRAGGTNLAVEVLWPPRNTDHAAHALKLLDIVEKQDARLDDVEVVTTPQQAEASIAKGRIAMLIALEGAHGLGTGDWKASLASLHERGLRMLGLTWSFSNRFAGSSGDGGGGLTDEGRALVAQAQKMGILIDLSHASRETTLEVCKASKVPVVASHSDAHAVAAQARNLTDAEIACIAATGGVIGLNFHATFVGGARDVAAVAAHADHIAKVAGHRAVALGSDFDGLIKVPSGLEDASKIPALWDALRARGWTEEQIAGAKGDNFMRAWKKATAISP